MIKVITLNLLLISSGECYNQYMYVLYIANYNI